MFEGRMVTSYSGIKCEINNQNFRDKKVQKIVTFVLHVDELFSIPSIPYCSLSIARNDP